MLLREIGATALPRLYVQIVPIVAFRQALSCLVCLVDGILMPTKRFHSASASLFAVTTGSLHPIDVLRILGLGSRPPWISLTVDNTVPRSFSLRLLLTSPSRRCLIANRYDQWSKYSLADENRLTNPSFAYLLSGLRRMNWSDSITNPNPERTGLSNAPIKATFPYTHHLCSIAALQPAALIRGTMLHPLRQWPPRLFRPGD